MRAFVFVLLSLILGAASGCDSSRDKSALRVQLSAEPYSLDPVQLEDGVGLRVITNVMQGLIGHDGDGQIVPWLAESYKISPDGRGFEFTIRKDARWSDGKPVTAEQFVAGFRRALSPKSPAKDLNLFFAIQGAQAFFRGRASEFSVRAIDGKLVIELEKPAPYFLKALTHPMIVPLRDEFLDKKGAWPENAPSTGPYRIVKHVHDQKIILERNPYYWGKPAPIPKVEFLIITDELAGVNLFKQGGLDVLTRVPPGDYQRLKRQGLLLSSKFVATSYLGFNTRKTPFQERHWRRAFSAIVDRQGLAAILDTGDVPARSWIPHGIEGYVPYENLFGTLKDSVAFVNKRKKEIGAIEVSYASGQMNTLVMEKIQGDIERGLGVKMKLSHMDWKSYIRAVQTDAPAVFRYAWQAPFMDPIMHLQVFMSDSPNNWTGWKNAQYDQLITEISRLPSGEERASKVRQAQRILVEDEAVIIPLYHYMQNTGVLPRVKGLRVNPYGVIVLNELSLEESQ